MHAYPASFRRRFEAELQSAFLAARGEPRYARRGGGALFWVDTLLDLCASASRQRTRQVIAAVRIPRPSPNKVDTMLHDLRHALRLVIRQPAFSAAAILSLALGIGGSSLIYGLVDGLVLHPFPYPDPDRLVSVGVTFPRQSSELRFVETLSPAEYFDFKKMRSFGLTTAFDLGNRNVSGGDEPERLFTALLLDDPFEVIGMRAVLGRGFLPEELAPNGPPVAIISHRVWQSRFGGDRQIVGRAIRIGGQAATVVGVMPPGLLLLGTDLWIPWGGDPSRMPRNVRQFTVLARLEPGSSLKEANAELAAVAGRVEQEFRGQFREYEGWRLEARPWAAVVTASLRDAAFVLFGAVLFVLLIACANVGNLLLARAAAHQRDVAMRLALGAARWRVARELLTESLLLSLAGAAGGLLLAAGGLAIAPQLLPAQVVALAPDISLSGRVLAFGLALTVISTVVDRPGSRRSRLANLSPRMAVERGPERDGRPHGRPLAPGLHRRRGRARRRAPDGRRAPGAELHARPGRRSRLRSVERADDAADAAAGEVSGRGHQPVLQRRPGAHPRAAWSRARVGRVAVPADGSVRDVVRGRGGGTGRGAAEYAHHGNDAGLLRDARRAVERRARLRRARHAARAARRERQRGVRRSLSPQRAIRRPPAEHRPAPAGSAVGGGRLGRRRYAQPGRHGAGGARDLHPDGTAGDVEPGVPHGARARRCAGAPAVGPPRDPRARLRATGVRDQHARGVASVGALPAARLARAHRVVRRRGARARRRRRLRRDVVRRRHAHPRDRHPHGARRRRPRRRPSRRTPGDRGRLARPGARARSSAVRRTRAVHAAGRRHGPRPCDARIGLGLYWRRSAWRPGTCPRAAPSASIRRRRSATIDLR